LVLPRHFFEGSRAESDDFGFGLPPESTCPVLEPEPLAPGESCVVVVRFSPSETFVGAEAAKYKDIFRWLNGESLQLPDTPGDALSQHLGGGGTDSESPLVDGSARVIPFTDDPGPWGFDLQPHELVALRAQVEAETTGVPPHLIQAFKRGSNVRHGWVIPLTTAFALHYRPRPAL
jgi:hypothetical protein